MTCVDDLKEYVGIKAACEHLGVARASYYAKTKNYQRKTKITSPKVQPRALSAAERNDILQMCNSERFCDQAPASIYATLLDKGVYLGSISSFYRILREQGQVHERRNQASHPPREKPELIALEPNTVGAGIYKGIWSQEIGLLLPLCDFGSLFKVCGWLETCQP